MRKDQLRKVLDAFDDLIIANQRLRVLLPIEEHEKLLAIQTQVIDLYLPWTRRWILFSQQWNATPDVEGREDLGAMDARDAAYERECRLAEKDTV